MRRSIRRLQLDLDTAVQTVLIEGARNTQPVRGLTHGFYKYPACFSPAFVRAQPSEHSRNRVISASIPTSGAVQRSSRRFG